MVIQSFITYRDEIHKKLELCLESNINVPKRARVATFPLSIVDHFCLLQQYKLSKIKIRLPRLIVIVPYGSIPDHSWLCDQPLKKPTLCIEREQHVSLTACQQSETQVCGIWTVNCLSMASKSPHAKIKENNVKTLFLHRVALVIILLYYSFGIIGIECFSGLQLHNCCP